ncbi:MAG: peptidylprolyl isomerase [Ignavibacteria bacterium]|nr:peptidylprolyl isomerase [Ignavibacteria bacterium]
MNRLKILCFFLSFILLAGIVYAQSEINENSILATAGSRSITKGAFETRFEMTPQLHLNANVLPEKRLAFLYTLLTEKLWAVDAEAKGLDTMQSIKTVTYAFENMFIRDALYMQEVRDKITYTNAQLLDAINKQRKILEVKYLFSEDSTAVFNYYRLLQSGMSFDTLVNNSEYAAELADPEKVEHGQMAEDIEAEVYKLDHDQYTKPLHTPAGWYIFKLYNYTEDLMVNPSDPEDKTVKKATQILRARIEKELFAKFFVNFFKGRKIDVNGSLLKSFAVHMSNQLHNRQITQRIKSSEDLSLLATDVLDLQHSIPVDSLSMTLVTLETKKYSLNDFILLLVFDGFKTKDIALNPLFRQIQARLRLFIESEVLAAEGRKRGLDKDPKVIQDVQTWRDNYLYQLNKYTMYDTLKVSDEEALAVYKKDNKEIYYPQQVNVIEILTDSLEIVHTVLERVKAGDDFRSLAIKYNKRGWTKKSEGEYGYFPIFMYDEIGKIAAKMDVGEVYGPIKSNDGYSIIKLIGKKADYYQYPKQSFQEMKDAIVKQLKMKMFKGASDRYSLKLSDKYGMYISPEVFKQISTSEINSLIVRKLGFGGQVTGAPLIAPDNDWVETYLKKFDVNP